MGVSDVIAVLEPFQSGLLALFGAAVAVMLVDRVIVWFQVTFLDYYDGTDV